jgi:hypothetical protein
VPSERPPLSAVGAFEPASVCTQPGQPGSSPACALCTASCSAEPADVDPLEALALAAGFSPVWSPAPVVEFSRYSFVGGDREAETEDAIRREVEACEAEERERLG